MTLSLSQSLTRHQALGGLVYETSSHLILTMAHWPKALRPEGLAPSPPLPGIGAGAALLFTGSQGPPLVQPDPPTAAWGRAGTGPMGAPGRGWGRAA